MSDKIHGLIDCMSGFVDKLAQLALDWRATCVPFGDLTIPGDRIVGQLPFVNSADDAKKQLRDMERFSGGGNVGESSIEAMLVGVQKPWRGQAVRVIVLLTDEPALDAHRTQEVLAQLSQHDILCFAATPDQDYFRSWAAQTAGKWYLIGQSMDTDELLKLLESMVTDVATVAKDVHALAGGSVRRYIELNSGSSHPEKR